MREYSKHIQILFEDLDRNQKKKKKTKKYNLIDFFDVRPYKREEAEKSSAAELTTWSTFTQ